MILLIDFHQQNNSFQRKFLSKNKNLVFFTKMRSHISSSSVSKQNVISSTRSKKYLKIVENSSKIKLSDYTPIKLLGKGAFGTVYSAQSPTKEIVAIKKVLEDPHYKNRELSIMTLLHNQNCIALKSSFKTKDPKTEKVYLHIIMEYLPLSLSGFISTYRQQRMYPPIFFVKLFAFQLFSGLNYLHQIGVTHRDIKPQNILVDPENGVLKICDFGSAKKIKPGETSIAYIASRFYRAPELVLGSTHYSFSIDIWAAGCVIAEIINSGSPLYQGRDSLDQINQIMKVIGPPTKDDLNSFDCHIELSLFPSELTPLQTLLPRHTPQDLLDLLTKIFVYNPSSRPSAQECLMHSCFNELFEFGLTMPNHKPLPRLDRRLSLPKL